MGTAPDGPYVPAGPDASVTLRHGPLRAGHPDPELSRAVLCWMVLSWTGVKWELVKVVPDSAAAKRLMRSRKAGPEPW
ncbi:DUF6087 family protein [Streptomyces sp. NPDC003077]|uniref:DUF6087 family protein n=1 Tax=Streptomyces sp. NPDC003077 TaxID=3154443 RepID=UPI0033A7E403